jgi:hypothetical protein
LNPVDPDRVTMVSRYLPFARVELCLGKEIKILGVADWEIHPLKNTPYPRVPAELAKAWSPLPIRQSTNPMSLGELIETFRIRSGLQFREASLASQRIAEYLADNRYFIAPSALSSYERLGTPPRHIHKIVSLCIVYTIRFWDFLRCAGMELAQLGQESIPEDLLPSAAPNMSKEPFSEDNNPPRLSVFSKSFFEEIPLFLRNALPRITGLANLSLRDVFWTGELRQPLHFVLDGSRFIIVNRRAKQAAQSPLSMPWEAPLCLVLMRDGTYTCGPCQVKNGTLILHPHPGSPVPPVELINKKDAEVAGQVFAVVRRFQ